MEDNRRVYLGKPENQKDPRAFNPRTLRDGPQGPAKPAGPSKTEKPRPDKPKLPSRLPPGSRAHHAPPKKEEIDDKSPFADNVFREDMTVREVNLRTLQQPSLSAATELSRATYQQMLVDDSNLNKQWSPEVFDYYTTAMLWLRIVHLTAKTLQPLTPAEETLISLTSTQAFNVPEPLRLYISSIGATTTKARQHLYPQFPPLPEQVVDNVPGLYGQIGVETHNLYEEIPALGISVGMIRASLNQARPLPQWVPPILPPHSVANPNLLGFRAVRAPRQQATEGV